MYLDGKVKDKLYTYVNWTMLTSAVVVESEAGVKDEGEVISLDINVKEGPLLGDNLTSEQKMEAKDLIDMLPKLFKTLLGCTELAEYEVQIEDAGRIGKNESNGADGDH